MNKMEIALLILAIVLTAVMGTVFFKVAKRLHQDSQQDNKPEPSK